MGASTPDAPERVDALSLNPILDIAYAFRQSFALRAAVDHDIFTAVGEGKDTVAAIAFARSISERGARVLCDFLVTLGLLRKSGERYECSAAAAAYLDRRSPASIAPAVAYLVGPGNLECAARASEVVRLGTLPEGEGLVQPEHPMWMLYAHAMASYMAMPAEAAAQLAELNAQTPTKVLDVAAGHGEFGIAVARRYDRARIVALDWPSVLSVTRDRFRAAGVEDRFIELPGSAFDLALDADYDLAIVGNFLHHFDEPTVVELLRKIRAALKPGSSVVIAEFVPNEDRVSPPIPARFAFAMLVSTPSGNAYTRADLERMLGAAGFVRVESHPVTSTPLTIVVARAPD